MKPEAISVTELNNYIKCKIDDDEYLNNIFVKGEILKDENSLIKCIMFKGYTRKS